MMVDSLRLDSLSFARMISYNLNASQRNELAWEPLHMHVHVLTIPIKKIYAGILNGYV